MIHAALCAGLFLVSSLAAQPVNIRFDHLTVEDGLSQSSVCSIVQDSDGFMWFGTQDGLNKYDGLNFKVYQNELSDSTSIENNFIRSIEADERGDIWVTFPNGGLDRFDAGEERFYHYDRQLSHGEPARRRSVSRAYRDKLGDIWLATNDGLGRYLRETDSFEFFLIDSLDRPQNVITALNEGDAGKLWVGTWAGRIFSFDRGTNLFEPLESSPNEAAASPAPSITGLYEDSRGQLWINTRPSSLIRYEIANGRAARFTLNPNPEVTVDVATMLEDRYGNMWFGTVSFGLVYYDRDSDTMTPFTHDPTETATLSGDKILSLYLDQAGTLWIGTPADGIDRFDSGRIKFRHFKSSFKNPEILKGDSIWALFEDSRGLIWIGTESGDVNLYDPKRETFRLLQQNGEADQGACYAIREDESGFIWLAYTGGALLRFDRDKNLSTPYHGKPEHAGLYEHAIRALHVDSQGILWVGSLGGGLNRYDALSDRFVQFTHIPGDSHSLSMDEVTAIADAGNGDLWVATYAGWNRFMRQTESFERFSFWLPEAHGFGYNICFSLIEDVDGVLWVGTQAGLGRLNPLTRETKFYTTKHGLPNSVIYAILTDDRRNLWLTTNRGLSRFNPLTETFKNYDVDDGLQSLEFNGGSRWKTRNGRMLFGGVNGFNIFHPDDISDNTNIPKIVITGLKKFDESIRFKNVDSPIQFSYEDSFISFEFAALNYTNPHKNQYAYKLEGLHDEWIYCGNQQVATFTNLDPGDYVFRVKGSNNDGVWNENGASLTLSISPPFWRAGWFLVGLFGLAICGLFLFFNHYKRKAERKEELNKKISALRLQALQAQMNPHFIFNTINSIQYYISSRDRKSAYKYLSKFSKLMRRTLDNSDKSTLTVADELESLKLYLELESLRFEGKFAYSIDVDPAIDLHNTEIPPLLIQPFVENSIQHGLRFKKKKGLLEVKLELAGDVINCMIKDNGIGIDRARELKSRNGGQQKAFGMKVTEERLAILNARRSHGTSLEIIDLSTNGMDGKIGTLLKIVIPIGSRT